MCIATSFLIAKTQRQPRCPLVDEWINKPWYLRQCNIIALKRNELSNRDKAWNRYFIK